MEVKKGFTLSEVMIAMTILGVLAAILVPVLTNTAPSTSKVMFKKAYSTIEKAINNMISDETNYPSDVTIIPLSDSISRAKGFNNTTAVTNSTYNKFCYLFTDQLNTTTGGTTSCVLATATGTNVFNTADGIVWNIITPAKDSDTNAETTTTVYGTTVEFPVGATAANSYLTKIIVDIDQSTKRSNTNCSADSSAASYNFNPGTGSAAITRCTNYNVNDAVKGYCSDNPDRFIFGIRYDGKIQVGSGASTDLCANQILSSPTENKQ